MSIYIVNAICAQKDHRRIRKTPRKISVESSTVKIKHSTLIGDYKDGGIKKADTEAKLKALKLTWIRRLCDDNHQPWKIIPTKYLTLPYGNSLFHRNFKSNHSHLLILKQLPVFYHDLIKYWEEISYSDSHSIDVTLSESLWYNRFLSICGTTIFLKDFFTVGINKVGDLYDTDLKLIHFEKFVQQGLSSQWYYNWMQLVESIPVSWTSEIRKGDNSHSDLSNSNYTLHIQRATTVETYNGLVTDFMKTQIQTKPTSQSYWEKNDQ